MSAHDAAASGRGPGPLGGASGRGPGPLGGASGRGPAAGSGVPEAPDTSPRDIACPAQAYHADANTLSLPSPAGVMPTIIIIYYARLFGKLGVMVTVY